MDCLRGRPRRRQVVQGMGVVGLGLLAGCGWLPFPSSPVRRIGFLVAGFLEPNLSNVKAFEQGLHEHGYVAGQNVIIEYRYGQARVELLPALAAELVGLKVDVLVTTITPTTRAAMQATSTIPIVMVVSGDPVGEGLVAGLARPGGNVTGLTMLAMQLSAKRLELLRDTLPSISRVAALWNPAEPGNAFAVRQIQDAAQMLGLELIPLEVHGPDDFESVLAAAIGERVEAFLIPASTIFFNHRARLVDVAAQNRLPGIYEAKEFVRDGGLMSYGASLPGLYRQAAAYVSKILQGSKPADLPVEQPREFELVINLKTAQALGLPIPHHVLLQATEVLQ
jgi:putative ABC transport system substrate-binding protein